MISSTRGIVFHTVPYSDNRVIAKIFTEEFGLRGYVVRISRSKTGNIKSSVLQPLMQIDLVVSHREKNTLHTVREISCNHPYLHIQDDIVKTSIALFVAEILYKSIKEEESNPQLFEFLTSSLQVLDLQHEGVANFHLCFLTQLTKYLGFFPQTNFSGDNSVFDLRDGIFRSSFPDHPMFVDVPGSRLLEQLLSINYGNMHTFKLTGEMRRMLVNHLLRYYELHLHGLHEVKSHQVLEAVLS
jgi:DNA repair protein RecO (recombination protein O)